MTKVDLDFIYHHLCIVWGFYDYPSTGMLKVGSHYFTFICTEQPCLVPNGKLDEDGDPDYDQTVGLYEIKSISKVSAWGRIINQAWFKLCVYGKGYSFRNFKETPKLVQWSLTIAKNKPKWVHDITYAFYFKDKQIGWYKKFPMV